MLSYLPLDGQWIVTLRVAGPRVGVGFEELMVGGESREDSDGPVTGKGPIHCKSGVTRQSLKSSG